MGLKWLLINLSLLQPRHKQLFFWPTLLPTPQFIQWKFENTSTTVFEGPAHLHLEQHHHGIIVVVVISLSLGTRINKNFSTVKRIAVGGRARTKTGGGGTWANWIARQTNKNISRREGAAVSRLLAINKSPYARGFKLQKRSLLAPITYSVRARDMLQASDTRALLLVSLWSQDARRWDGNESNHVKSNDRNNKLIKGGKLSLFLINGIR